MLSEANLNPLSSTASAATGICGKVTHVVTYDRCLTPEEADAAIPATLRIPGTRAWTASHMTPLKHPVPLTHPFEWRGQIFHRLHRDTQQLIYEQEDQTVTC
jgi:hypothetical protein